MARYLAWRLAQAVFVVWAAFTASFVVLFALPSDPVEVMVGPNMGLTPEELQAIRVDLGLDGSFGEQYVQGLVRLAHGDLGESVQSRRPVTGLIADVLPSTVGLTLAGLALALVFGTLLAVAATLAPARRLRELLLGLPPLGVAVPVFWVGLVLIQLFSFRWNLFPAIGGEGAAGLVLPALTLALPAGALIAQLLARGLQDALAQPYIDTARAKGLSRTAVHLRHALRNAVLPALTMVGLIVGSLLSGSVIVETVFSRDGLGRLATTSVTNQDLPVVQGLVLVGAVVFALVNLLVDLAYPLVDPRIARDWRRRPPKPEVKALPVS